MKIRPQEMRRISRFLRSLNPHMRKNSIMKTTVMLLLTNDIELEDSVAEALLEFGGVSHLKRDAGNALETVCGVHDLDLAVIDFEHGPHGMTLLSAISMLREDLPIIVITHDDEKHVEALAYTKGPRPVFKNRFRPQLMSAIRKLQRLKPERLLTNKGGSTNGKNESHVFHGTNNIRDRRSGAATRWRGEAVIRVTLTTICGTDLHILRGEYPVKPGLYRARTGGRDRRNGSGVTGYAIGDRVLVGAITPCGQCRACLSGHWSQCGHGEGYEAIGGWRFGNTINGAQAEYLLVPDAQANLAKIPDELTDEQVVLLADIASTGFSGAESGNIRIGDSVAVFAQGPIGFARQPEQS